MWADPVAPPGHPLFPGLSYVAAGPYGGRVGGAAASADQRSAPVPGLSLGSFGPFASAARRRRWSSREAISRRVSPDRRPRGLALSPKG
jgi:hypothetical protein